MALTNYIGGIHVTIIYLNYFKAVRGHNIIDIKSFYATYGSRPGYKLLSGAPLIINVDGYYVKVEDLPNLTIDRSKAFTVNQWVSSIRNPLIPTNQIYFLSDSASRFVQRTIDDSVFWPKLESNLDKSKLTNCTSDDLCVKTIDELFSLFEKSAPQLRGIYPAKSTAKAPLTAALTPCDESFSNKFSGTDEALDSQVLTPQGHEALIDISKGPEYKSQRHTVNEWLREHKGIGYSNRWNESQQAYADLVRQRYTVFGKFVAKTEENERKSIDEKNKGIAYSKGLKPGETEAEKRAKKTLSSRKSRFYNKMFKEGKSASEIDVLWEKEIKSTQKCDL